MNSAEKIQAFIIKHLAAHPADIVAFAAQSMDITRTTVLRHLKHLIRQGKVVKTGATKNTFYSLKEAFEKKVVVKIPSQLGEFEIFKQNFAPSCAHLPKTVSNICMYGVTEMINNAFDHANAKKVVIELRQDNFNIIFIISDDGVGIFKKISDYLHFHDLREAILQINKGKFTTDRKNHTGEGIFFTSRAFDYFSIISNGIHYSRDNINHDWFVETVHPRTAGTTIKMIINQHSSQNLTELFIKFQNPETLAFDKTEITVELSKFGEEAYISRSQAKRILMNLDEFHVVTLDFKGVQIIGQGFADEVFRVYQNKYPDKQINYINANNDIDFMIKRAVATGIPPSSNKD